VEFALHASAGLIRIARYGILGNQRSTFPFSLPSPPSIESMERISLSIGTN
jgi:hypothetical protein